MQIQSQCPACGAPLVIEENIKITTCPFCSNRFQVGLEGVQPEFAKLPPASLTGPVEGPEIRMEEREEPAEALERFPEPEVLPLPPAGGQEPPKSGGFFNLPRLFGGRLWLVIALIVTSFICLSCLCTFVVVRGILGLIGQ